MNKWDAWWDNLSPHTKEYLKSQSLWHDIDLAKAFGFGLLIGFILGVIL